jgi:hypothetical protein
MVNTKQSELQRDLPRPDDGTTALNSVRHCHALQHSSALRLFCNRAASGKSL